jgi:hypothetical protein
MFDPAAYHAQQQELIDRYGWAVTAVVPGDDEPDRPFAYTVGLTAHDQPELVIAGLDPITSQALLNDLAGRVLHQAARFTDRQRISDLISGHDAVVIDGVATEVLYPGAAFGRYGQDRVRLQQIVWPDREGRFPWQPGYGYPEYVQPLLRALHP